MKNGILMQYFEWYLPNDGEHWNRLAKDAEHLAQKGVTAIWIPPACKGTGANDVGYGVYDLYDLGEYNQKGTVRTKYGTKEQLIKAIEACHENGIQVYGDCVMNHKAGADETELFKAIRVNPDQREEALSEPYDIEGWTKFDFPGRTDREVSDFRWNFTHFSGVDFDEKSSENGIFRIVGDGKNWSQDVSNEFGNFDYLMHADIDHAAPGVTEELIHWGKWYIDTLKLDGLRLDAVKHISSEFMQQFATAMREEFGDELYMVGEYWQGDHTQAEGYMEETAYEVDLFDVALHFHFMEIGQKGMDYDLRKVFDGTTVQDNPMHAVTFVDNHDSQPGQALESCVADWFKPSAYALILLRKDGYPCVFYGDYYGTGGEDSIPSHQDVLDRLFLLRRHYAYGQQDDYFDSPHTIGWVRHTNGKKAHPLAVIINISTEPASIKMYVGEQHEGYVFTDYLGNSSEKVTIDADGFGEFPVQPGSLSCWLKDGLPLDDIDVEVIDK